MSKVAIIYKSLRLSRLDENGKPITQYKLAKILNINQGHISQIESGKREPSKTELIAYAKEFNTTTDYLLGIRDSNSENFENHPSDYQGNDECIDVMLAMFGTEIVKHFCMCNSYKYRFLASKNNNADDIKEAEWYEAKLIELGGKDGHA